MHDFVIKMVEYLVFVNFFIKMTLQCRQDIYKIVDKALFLVIVAILSKIKNTIPFIVITSIPKKVLGLKLFNNSYSFV